MTKALILLVVASTLFTFGDVQADDNVAPSKDSAAIFNERILPIFRSKSPSSCVQCHLSSVDLKNYILPSHEKTFVSLRDQGLVDLKNPEASKILQLIKMGDDDPDDYSKRIHADMRKAEYEAFADWVIASCKDQRLCKLPPLKETELAQPASSNEVIRHARKSRVLDSFERKVWSQRMRCFPCHTPEEIGPRQKGAKEKFDQWYDQYGDQMLIFKKTPVATLRYLVDQSKKSDANSLPLLNLEQPNKSLLILKPMSKVPPKVDDERVPTYLEPVYHMGGLKIHKDDHSYKAFVSWVKDYADVSKGEYKSVDDLPIDNWFPTQRILRLKETSADWPVGTTLQMFVHARNKENGWSKEPLAFTQGTITPRKIANGALIALAPTNPTEFETWKEQHNKLRPGSYLVKVFVDLSKKLESDPTSFLGDSDFVGQIEIKQAHWRVGFPKAEWISGASLEK